MYLYCMPLIDIPGHDLDFLRFLVEFLKEYFWDCFGRRYIYVMVIWTDILYFLILSFFVLPKCKIDYHGSYMALGGILF